jgi:hypothetical protein
MLSFKRRQDVVHYVGIIPLFLLCLPSALYIPAGVCNLIWRSRARQTQTLLTVCSTTLSYKLLTLCFSLSFFYNAYKNISSDMWTNKGEDMSVLFIHKLPVNRHVVSYLLFLAFKFNFHHFYVISRNNLWDGYDFHSSLNSLTFAVNTLFHIY